MPIKEYVDKGKRIIRYFQDGTSLNTTEIEQKIEYVNSQIMKHNLENQKVPMNEKLTREEMNQSVDTSGDRLHVEERIKIMNPRKALHHYKTQNSHLNNFNDQLV